ncbi:hypothetical protein [Roseimaritima sediminicola]|uniref:hypothetical protein n=1 Tax=Roseimaritima sediminicola TaxID=2662066 RepID=UPI0012982C7C|nr:hypothetical protein [Roseimaritima sediminicola]
MRTISYGIPILFLGVLAALPFRRVPEPSSASSEAADPAPETIQPTALVEVQPRGAWVPSPAELSPRPAPAPAPPPLPTDYTEVAVPLATPPAIARRYEALEMIEERKRSGADIQYQLPPRTENLAQSGAGWQTDLPLAVAAPPSTQPGPTTQPEPWPQRSSESIAQVADASPPSPAGMVSEPTGTRLQRPAAAAASEGTVTALKASFGTRSQPHDAASSSPPAPRKRYYIREPQR